MVDRTDDFNRSNGGLGANWTTRTDANNVGSLVINGNKVVVNATNEDSVAYWSADSFANDQYSQFVFGGGGGHQASVCVAVRVSDSGTLKYYEFEGSSGGFGSGILYYDGTTWNTLTVTSDPTATDVVKITVTGTSLVVQLNGAGTFSSTTDASLASGFAGLHIYDTFGAASLDDWLGGPIAAAGAAPFVPTDTSIEVQPDFPVSLRTWVSGFNPNLFAQVVSLPPGLQGLVFELPKRAAPAGPTWTWQYNPNLVGKDVVPPGRKGLVFEGPPKGAPPAGQTWTSRYNDNLIGKDVFPSGRNGISFERPQPISWRREWTLNLLQTTLAPSTAQRPFVQSDWPLPQRASQPDRTWVSSAATLQLMLPPPGDIWTDLPPAPMFWRNGSALNLVLTTLLAQDSFPTGQVRSDRLPPLDWRAGWTLNLLQGTLAPSFAAPFAQYDWPLPRVAAQPDRTWTTFFNPNLIGQDAFPPGAVRSDRPLPIAWQNGFQLNLVLTTLASVVQLPLNQYNWSIPGQGWQPPRTWTSFYNINLIGKDQFPIRQMDWPLPFGYFYPASVRLAVPLNVNLFPPPAPPVVTQEYRNVKVAGGEFGFMGLRGGVIG